MAPSQIVFILFAVMTLGSALMVVTARNLIHSALWLIVTLFGIACFFAILNAGFLAVAQVVIYIGAIAILVIFAVMLTRRVAQDTGPQVNVNWFLAALVSVILFAGLVWLVRLWPGFATSLPVLSGKADPLRDLGLALVSTNGYVLPFEVASILLLAALIGAIIIAWDKKSR